MRRGLLIFVFVCTLAGLALTIATLQLLFEKGGAGLSGEAKGALLITAAIGLLIGTVGMGVFAIVAAIRDLPHEP